MICCTKKAPKVLGVNRNGSLIKKGYLEIEYTDRLPMPVFSKMGWKIEREANIHTKELTIKTLQEKLAAAKESEASAGKSLPWKKILKLLRSS